MAIMTLFLLHVLSFKDIPVLNVNSVYLDQRWHSVASDLGLHCLPVLSGFPNKMDNNPLPILCSQRTQNIETMSIQG